MTGNRHLSLTQPNIGWVSLLNSASIEDASFYPMKPWRYFPWGWNHYFQYCYTIEEIQLLDKIKQFYQAYIKHESSEVFAIHIEKKFYELWQCHRPAYLPLLTNLASKTFTLPASDAKAKPLVSLWEYADNMARKIANWQAERIKNQASDLVNDPVMLVFEELKNWFYLQLPFMVQKEDIALINQRQLYLKNIIHSVENFGPDRNYLYHIHNSLDEVTAIISKHIANRKLPELLNEVIISSKNLENIGRYLHYLLINEPVADNYASNFLDLDNKQCHLSPLCKLNRAAQLNPLSLAGIEEISLNKFYHYHLLTESDGIKQIQFSLKHNLLNTIKFASFVTYDHKINYLQAVATLDSLIHIRAILETFKQIQASLGTYHFAAVYVKTISELAKNYMDLINKAQMLINQMLTCANHGFEASLNKNEHLQNKFFENNLRILETHVTVGMTISNQLQDYCLKAKESMFLYQQEITSLAKGMNEQEVQIEMEAAMQTLLVQMQKINMLVPSIVENKDRIAYIEASKNIALPTPSMPALATLVESGPYLEKDFDVAFFDPNVRYDPISKQRIYTFQLWKDQSLVGEIQLLGKPRLCVSSDRSQHNIINQWGILSEYKIATDLTVQESCDVYAPTLTRRIIYSGIEGAVQGGIRGSRSILALALTNHGMRSNLASSLSYIYYGSALWLMNLYYSYQYHQTEVEGDYIDLLYESAVATRNILIINTVLDGLSYFLNKGANYCQNKGYTLASYGLRAVNALCKCSIFAHSAVNNSIAETTTSVALGISTEISTQKLGVYLISKKS